MPRASSCSTSTRARSSTSTWGMRVRWPGCCSRGSRRSARSCSRGRGGGCTIGGKGREGLGGREEPGWSPAVPGRDLGDAALGPPGSSLAPVVRDREVRMLRGIHWLRPISLALVAGLFALPLWFVISASLHREGTGLGLEALVPPAEPQWQNYRLALERMGGFERFLANTLLVTVLSILGQCFTCSLAGYAFARLSFRGRDVLFT